MIIKSHIRGGYRAAADYLKDIGQNETTRLVSISDPDAKTLDQAFQNMWAIASASKVKKPLHHISINPMKDERLTDYQVTQIVERCEQKYGYKPGEHQCVIVEHVKDGRQHFHVIWNRVNLETGKAVWPGQHWLKSKQVCREMEVELGLKRPMPKRVKRVFVSGKRGGRINRYSGRYRLPTESRTPSINKSGIKHIDKGLVFASTIHESCKQSSALRLRKNNPFTLNRMSGSFSASSLARPQLQSTAHSFRHENHVPQRPMPNVMVSPLQKHSAPHAPVLVKKDGALKQPTMLHRPISRGNMSKEQWSDYMAACEGKITWAQYFKKWGDGVTRLTP